MDGEYAWRGRIGYLKMWEYKNELLLYNPWLLVESGVKAFSVLRQISSIHFSYHQEYIFHGYAETNNYLYIFVLNIYQFYKFFMFMLNKSKCY